MEHCGTSPLEFWKFCAFCSFCQLNCKNFEIYQRNTFSSISPEPQNSPKRIKTVSELEKCRAGGERKKLCCAPSPHFLATPFQGRMNYSDCRQTDGRTDGRADNQNNSFFLEMASPGNE